MVGYANTGNNEKKRLFVHVIMMPVLEEDFLPKTKRVRVLTHQPKKIYFNYQSYITDRQFLGLLPDWIY